MTLLINTNIYIILIIKKNININKFVIFTFLFLGIVSNRPIILLVLSAFMIILFFFFVDVSQINLKNLNK